MEYKKEVGMSFYCDECNFGCNSDQLMMQHKEKRHKKQQEILEPTYPVN
jgi:hypothetical protein